MTPRFVIACALFALWAAPRVARADPVDPTPLLVVIAGEARSASRLEGVVNELIGRLHVRVQVSRAERIEPREVVTPRAALPVPLARAWLDIATPGTATLYLADGPWERILVRHVPRPPGEDEVANDALGHILEAAVEALLDGAHIGMDREKAERTLAPPAEVPSSSPPSPPAAPPTLPVPPLFHSQLGVAYEGQLYAPQALVAHGPVVSLRLVPRVGAAPWGGWLAVQYRVPIVVDDAAQPAGVRLDMVSPRAGGSFDLLAQARSTLRVDLGAGADLVRVEPRALAPAGVSLQPAYFTAVVALRTGVVYERELSPDLSFFASLALEVDPTRTRFVIDEAGTSQAVVAPWPVRPSLALGIASPGARP